MERLHLTDNGKEIQPLIEALVTTVFCDTWAENGGGKAEIRSVAPGLLVVSQTRAVHEELANVLTAICRAKEAE